MTEEKAHKHVRKRRQEDRRRTNRTHRVGALPRCHPGLCGPLVGPGKDTQGTPVPPRREAVGGPRHSPRDHHNDKTMWWCGVVLRVLVVVVCVCVFSGGVHGLCVSFVGGVDGCLCGVSGVCVHGVLDGVMDATLGFVGRRETPNKTTVVPITPPVSKKNISSHSEPLKIHVRFF